MEEVCHIPFDCCIFRYVETLLTQHRLEIGQLEITQELHERLLMAF
jgi:hypothetical protein